MTAEKVEDIYGIKTNFLEIMQIGKSFDKTIIEYIIKNVNQLKERRKSISNKIVLLTEKDRIIDMEHSKCNEIYWLYVENIGTTPASFTMWHRIFPRLIEIDDIVWYNTLNALKMYVTSFKMQSFHYKVIYNIINCNLKLYEWKIIDSSKCSFCAEIDRIDHYFIYCKRTQKFWNSLFNWWNNLSEIEISLKQDEIAENIIFGFNLIDDKYILINFIILHAKYFIYQCNQGEPKFSIDLFDFLIFLKGKLLIEKAILIKSPKIHKRIIGSFCDLM
jgi:hypothetical protein